MVIVVVVVVLVAASAAATGETAWNKSSYVQNEKKPTKEVHLTEEGGKDR